MTPAEKALAVAFMVIIGASITVFLGAYQAHQYLACAVLIGVWVWATHATVNR